MKTLLYTIFDNVAVECGPIFQAKNLLVASRYVNQMIKDTHINPSDYELVCLGSFDSETLEFKVFSPDERSSVPLSSAFILGVDSKDVMEDNDSSLVVPKEDK